MKRVFEKVIVWFAIIILFFCSCENKSFYNEHISIEGNVWDRDRVAYFELMVDDTVSNYTCTLHLRHLETYRYSNLYLFLNTRFPNGFQVRDTIECILALPDGKWLSKGSGSLRDMEIPLNPALRFPIKGTYMFEIEQAMRDELLEGISDIGLKIEDVK